MFQGEFGHLTQNCIRDYCRFINRETVKGIKNQKYHTSSTYSVFIKSFFLTWRVQLPTFSLRLACTFRSCKLCEKSMIACTSIYLFIFFFLPTGSIIALKIVRMQPLEKSLALHVRRFTCTHTCVFYTRVKNTDWNLDWNARKTVKIDKGPAKKIFDGSQVSVHK